MNENTISAPIYSLTFMTDELMYQIIFCMEDQAGTYVFDMADGVPIQKEFTVGGIEERKTRYRELPSWKPADGFRIMEKFVSSLRNPIFREKLKESLSMGRGVFRSFKNNLKEEPAIERLWFYFKEREIKRSIYIWYEQLTEISFLEQLGEPEQDVSDLILSDFVVTEDREKWVDYILKIGESRLDDEFSGVDYPLNEILVQEYQKTWAEFNKNWLIIFVESPLEDFAGFIGAEPLAPDDTTLVYSVKHLYVEPRFRGLGIFKLLADSLCSRAAESGAERVIIELSGKSSVISPALEQRGFVPFSERFSLDLAKWKQDQRGE